MAPTELDIATTQLANVRTAIDTVLIGPGQSYTMAGRSFTKADLATLRRMESDLLARVNRLSRGGLRIQRAYPLG
jgi:hypothetical protein